MIKVGKWIAKHKILIIIIGIALLTLHISVWRRPEQLRCTELSAGYP